MPFVIGAVIAWIVQKPADKLSDKLHFNHSHCAGGMAVAVFISLAALITMIAVLLLNTAVGFFSDFTVYIKKAAELINEYKEKFYSLFENLPEEFLTAADSFYNGSFTKIIDSAASAVSYSAAGIAKKLPAFAVSSIVAAVASCYIASDYKGLVRFFRSVCGKRIYENTLRIKNIFTESVLKLIKGYIKIMVLTFFELLAGLLILRVKYAPFIAVLVSLIDILPVLGCGTVLIPWAVIDICLHNFPQGIGLIVLYALITLVRNFAEPKIIGKEIGINPLFMLLSMFIGVKLLGFAGVFIFPVTFIVIVKYYKEEMQ